MLEAIEFSAFAMWIREAHYVVYTGFLALHTIGLIFLVGISAAVALRVLGVAPGMPLQPLTKYFPLMWIGFWINAITGLGLIVAAAQSFLTNPVFYFKMLSIAVAIVGTKTLYTKVLRDRAEQDLGPIPTNAKVWAGISLLFWAFAIFMGRMTAYSAFVVWESAGAVFITAVVLLVGGFLVARVFGWGTPPSQQTRG